MADNKEAISKMTRREQIQIRIDNLVEEIKELRGELSGLGPESWGDETTAAGPKTEGPAPEAGAPSPKEGPYKTPKVAPEEYPSKESRQKKPKGGKKKGKK